jgi:large subunit ribosomal protein L24
MNIKKNDNVIVLTGKDKGKKGKVLKALPTDMKVVVEGVNVRNRRTKARKSNEKGQVIAKPLPVAVSNVQVVCSSCGKGTRVKFEVLKGKKTRACVKCGKTI